MKAWFWFKASVLWLVGAALVAVGVLSIGTAAALFIWQYVHLLSNSVWVALPLSLLFAERAAVEGSEVAAILPFLPQIPAPAWLEAPAAAWVLEHVHVGIPFLIVGVLVLSPGRRLARRQAHAMRWYRRLAQDRKRRREAYRSAPPAPPPTLVTREEH